MQDMFDQEEGLIVAGYGGENTLKQAVFNVRNHDECENELGRVPVLFIFSLTHTHANTPILPCVNTNTTNNTSLKRRDLVFFRSKFFRKFSKIFQKISKNFKNFLRH